jgi:hypothetical protein
MEQPLYKKGAASSSLDDTGRPAINDSLSPVVDPGARLFKLAAVFVKLPAHRAGLPGKDGSSFVVRGSTGSP